MNVPPRLVDALGVDPLSLSTSTRLVVASDVTTSARQQLVSGMTVKGIIETHDELAAQRVLSNMRGFAFDGECWWASLVELVGDDIWAALTPGQRWELADVRAEYLAYLELGDDKLYVPPDFIDLQCPRLIARGVSETTLGNWVKCRLAVNLDKRVHQLNARASGRSVRLDFTVPAAKAVGAKWLLTVVGEDGHVLGMKAGNSTCIEEYADFLRDLSSAHYFDAVVLFIGEEQRAHLPACARACGVRRALLRLAPRGLRRCCHVLAHTLAHLCRADACPSHPSQTTCRRGTRTRQNTSSGSRSCCG